MCEVSSLIDHSLSLSPPSSSTDLGRDKRLTKFFPALSRSRIFLAQRSSCLLSWDGEHRRCWIACPVAVASLLHVRRSRSSGTAFQMQGLLLQIPAQVRYIYLLINSSVLHHHSSNYLYYLESILSESSYILRKLFRTNFFISDILNLPNLFFCPNLSIPVLIINLIILIN